MSAALLVAVVHLLTLPGAVPERERDGTPHLRSESVIVRVADTGTIVLRKNPDVVRPIASVTKLLSGLILARLGVDEALSVTIGEDDKDRLKWSRSRMRVGLTVPWGQLITVALAASDNRAMNASVRSVMARTDFVTVMNKTARDLGMTASHFADPTGIDPNNVSTATDMLQLLEAASGNSRLCSWALTPSIELATERGVLTFNNPDRLVHRDSWEVVVGKTGYTIEAGRTLVLRVKLAGRPVDMVFLGAREMQSVFGDAGRVKRWLLPQLEAQAAVATQAPAAVATGAVSSDTPAAPAASSSATAP